MESLLFSFPLSLSLTSRFLIGLRFKAKMNETEIGEKFYFF